mmetsp:Transcript_76801/g.220588  ORF Transcript_76801/g.220588 Transcript_76801/m.220588 type:complete len:159 (+) Transcript_76801:135-611(+)
MDPTDPIWTVERQTRPQKVIRLSGGYTHVVHDRSSAHVAAWNSVHREAGKEGDHFKLDDSRIWMRLMFWSAREQCLLENENFAYWFVGFIGHFVKIYESTAPMFARESARWSADPANIQTYLDNGRRMDDVRDVPLREAARDVPAAEARDRTWPYEEL